MSGQALSQTVPADMRTRGEKYLNNFQNYSGKNNEIE